MESRRSSVVSSTGAVITAVLGVYAVVRGTIWVSVILFVLMSIALLTLLGAWAGDIAGWIKGWSDDPANPKGVVEHEPTPALTSLWRSTTDGLEASSVSTSLQKTVNHPGYMRDGYAPATTRVVLSVLVGCGPISDTLSTTQLVKSFLDLISGPLVGTVTSILTEVADSLSWHTWWTNGLLNNQAVLARTVDDQEVPPAAAILNLNDSSVRIQPFQDTERAELILIIEPEALGAQFEPLSLEKWHAWLLEALKLPAAFANFLPEQVHVPTFDDPPAVVGVLLQGRNDLTDLIDVSGFQLSPAMRASGSFPTYLVADRAGSPPSEAAAETLRILCDHGLHALGYETQLNKLRQQ